MCIFDLKRSCIMYVLIYILGHVIVPYTYWNCRIRILVLQIYQIWWIQFKYILGYLYAKIDRQYRFPLVCLVLGRSWLEQILKYYQRNIFFAVAVAVSCQHYYNCTTKTSRFHQDNAYVSVLVKWHMEKVKRKISCWQLYSSYLIENDTEHDSNLKL